MLKETFVFSIQAVFQIFFLAAVGFFLVKKKILSDEGLDNLSRLVIELTLPFLIFSQLIQEFSFSLYRNWWFFPLASLGITLFGFICGIIFMGLIKDKERRPQFLSLVAFQNSGYLPLVLTASFLPKEQAEVMFIYIFLFLLGFNLLIWSLGVYMLSFKRVKKIELANFFSPPVLATLISLVLVFFKLDQYIPFVLLKPMRMIGDGTLFLAMLVVGGNLAQIKLGSLYRNEVSLILLLKMLLMPLMGLILILVLRPPELVGLLLLLQLAMPPAISLSVITRYFRINDVLINQTLFIAHIFSLLTIPIFLSLYFAWVVVK